LLDGDIIILRGSELASLLEGREEEVIGVVRDAYVTHADGESSLPFSNFLRFPDEPRNRIIALPAYLGKSFNVAGVKWISSFPGNLDQGIDRASAVMVLNSTQTGRPQAILEGALISAKRTAASAALAARTLRGELRPHAAALIGCGFINSQIARFLLTACPEIRTFFVYDTDVRRAEHFRESCVSALPGVSVEVVGTIAEALASSPLISFATTAIEPHVTDLSPCAQGSTILHVSLRDLAPELILAHDNVVDDAEHVCQANTSAHLAEQKVGNREFIRCALADVLSGRAEPRRSAHGITIFSPFGLGVLDIALAKLVFDKGIEQGQGTIINSFLPESWSGK
jgi:2,3-diaminopropionate biosynthesis protein SbnB